MVLVTFYEPNLASGKMESKRRFFGSTLGSSLVEYYEERARWIARVDLPPVLEPVYRRAYAKRCPSTN